MSTANTQDTELQNAMTYRYLRFFRNYLNAVITGCPFRQVKYWSVKQNCSIRLSAQSNRFETPLSLNNTFF
jgi:hypothetical protein